GFELVFREFRRRRFVFLEGGRGGHLLLLNGNWRSCPGSAIAARNESRPRPRTLFEDDRSGKLQCTFPGTMLHASRAWTRSVLHEDPQVWRGDRQGNIALIHSAPTSCCAG